MPSASHPESSGAPKTALFALFTLAAWMTAAFLFILLKRAPLTRGAPVITYFAIPCSLLPWLAGYVFWIKVRKRAKMGVADGDSANFCYSIIFINLCTAYVALVSVGTVLLWVLTRVK
jgi:hypothetical protein